MIEASARREMPAVEPMAMPAMAPAETLALLLLLLLFSSVELSAVVRLLDGEGVEEEAAALGVTVEVVVVEGTVLVLMLEVEVEDGLVVIVVMDDWEEEVVEVEREGVSLEDGLWD